jgi:anaerobic selenocysteine-containing dehydrogenase
VRDARELFGELPVACLAEEIDTPGEGRVRALITVAGNPVVSTPNGDRLDAALDQLDFMVSVDAVVNATTRHADVILPVPSPLQRSHYDVYFTALAVRNVANYSPAVLPLDMPDEWETLLRLMGIIAGAGDLADVSGLDDFVAQQVAQRLAGEHADALLAQVEGRRGPERLLDLMLRTGTHGLTLADLEAAPHGIDLGPLEPRLPGLLKTPSGRVELAPPAIVADVERLRDRLAAAADDGSGMVLIGRRHLRSNNSWMHLGGGRNRLTAQVHPADAERLGLVDGEQVRVASRVGAIELPVEVTDEVMAGVVSIPHGWDSANSNVLTDETLVEPLSGTAVLNGIPVDLAPVREPVPA